MGRFYQRDPYRGYNIYSMKKYVDKKRITAMVILSVMIVIILGMILYYSLDTISRLQIAKQYTNQVLQYQQEQEEKQAQLLAEQERIRKERLPNLTEKGKENIKNIYHSDTKRVFLTFDDGPSQNTNVILDILKQEEIKATFFVLGSRVETMPETTKRLYEEGHYIANHGYSHVYSSIYQSSEEVLNEFTRCNIAVQNAIGQTQYNSHLFRYPGGYIGGKYAEVKKQASSLLDQNGIAFVDWNALTGDSEKKDPSIEYLMNNLIHTTSGKNSVVILMHDSLAKTITVETLPQVIQYLREQGYEFKSFYDVIE